MHQFTVTSHIKPSKLLHLHHFCTQAISGKPKSLILKKCIALLHAYCASSKYRLKQIHAFSIKHGVHLACAHMCKHLIFFSVSLSESMLYAENIFSQIQDPDIFTWNTMIRGYAESENPRSAIELYTQMQVNGIEPDLHTYPFLMKAVAKMLDTTLGEKIHCITIRKGFESLVFLRNTILHFYGVCEQVESALKIFESIPERNLVTWNCVINGLALNGRPSEVLALFRDMGSEGIMPDGFTMVSLLSTCAEIGALSLGRRAHVYMFKVGLNKNLHAGNTLLDFYAKCGRIREAELAFCEMEDRSVVSWTSLIIGMAVNGFGLEAIKLFKRMEMEELVPTDITFVGVLYACSHCGMVDEGFDYLSMMEKKYGIKPKIEHYGCIVDMLGRAGKVSEAYEYIQTMPLQPSTIVWRSLLGASSIHGHLDLAQIARTELLRQEPKHCGDYVLLSNLYALEKCWSDVHNVRKKMLKDGVKKTPGRSLVELRNCVHEFVMGDRRHTQDKDIYDKLAEIIRMLKLEGYLPHTENVLADIQEEEKETILSYHSEKIAIAFMLLNTAARTPITVIKNLRVCVDCHVAIKLISKIYDREIVVRDQSRFHHFKDGSCSCGDYW